MLLLVKMITPTDSPGIFCSALVWFTVITVIVSLSLSVSELHELVSGSVCQGRSNASSKLGTSIQ